ncbi:MFS transporter [Actinomadura craniellae]|uniref:MFS transporter n=1 Tax=Actinomadura craniellae TaxID=2231787 RepID=A0A365HCH0_9ACTN|nr:MFS transporter [Actinomadura craniellae]RAY16840.1 MFS transporter [Actinomadura craniellae]
MNTPAGPLGRALAEPTAPVSKLWVLWLVLAVVGLWSSFFGPIQVLLAQQAEAVAPDHKEAVLSLVTGVGAAVSMVCTPLWGAFSDRTTSRLGRRLPWVAGGVVGGVIALALLSRADSVWSMVLAWALAQGSLNAMFAAIVATVPDQVPARERGAVGGVVSIAQTLGVIGGTGIAAATGGVAAGYLTLAGALVLTTLPYVLDSRDIRLPRELRPELRWGPFLRGFWISPREHPDFAWAWITRFLMIFGNALLILYLLYYLKDAVGLAADRAEDGVFLLTAVYGACTVVTAFLGGLWSDRTGKRKAFVTGAGLIAAGALLLFAFVPTWPAAFAGAIVLGIGFGAYTAVDFALITQVLPGAGARGKDLGVINIANTLPQVLAPVLAAGVIALGLGYTVLYSLAAVVSVLGSILVGRIKSVA